MGSLRGIGLFLATTVATMSGPMPLLAFHRAVGGVPAAVVDRLGLALPTPLLLLARGQLLAVLFAHFRHLLLQRFAVFLLQLRSEQQRLQDCQ